MIWSESLRILSSYCILSTTMPSLATFFSKLTSRVRVIDATNLTRSEVDRVLMEMIELPSEVFEITFTTDTQFSAEPLSAEIESEMKEEVDWINDVNDLDFGSFYRGFFSAHCGISL